MKQNINYNCNSNINISNNKHIYNRKNLLFFTNSANVTESNNTHNINIDNNYVTSIKKILSYLRHMHIYVDLMCIFVTILLQFQMIMIITHVTLMTGIILLKMIAAVENGVISLLKKMNINLSSHLSVMIPAGLIAIIVIALGTLLHIHLFFGYFIAILPCQWP